MRTNPIRILLVEDDLDVAAGIGDFLDAHGIEVDFAYNAAQARVRLQDAVVDLLLIDVGLPGEDGISLCRDLKLNQGLRQPAIFLTARGELVDKLQGFEVGAVDYLVKPVEPAELLARIRALVAYTGGADSALLEAGDYRLDPQLGLLFRGAQSLPLQATALLIMHRLMQAYPGTVSRQALCDELWGGEAPDSDPLRSHVYFLRQTLLERFGEAPIVTVRGLGYRLGSAP